MLSETIFATPQKIAAFAQVIEYAQDKIDAEVRDDRGPPIKKARQGRGKYTALNDNTLSKVSRTSSIHPILERMST